MNIKNYYAPTPVFWRKIGDFALLMIPTIQGTLLAFPEISDLHARIITAVSSVLMLAIKFWTNTKKVH